MTPSIIWHLQKWNRVYFHTFREKKQPQLSLYRTINQLLNLKKCYINNAQSEKETFVSIAALDQQPSVSIKTMVKKGTRELTLTLKVSQWWENTRGLPNCSNAQIQTFVSTTKAFNDMFKPFCPVTMVLFAPQPMHPAASISGVNYSITDTQTSQKCPCKHLQQRTQNNTFTTYVSYSAVNISVTACNAVGSSPVAVEAVGPMPTSHVKGEYTLEDVRRCGTSQPCNLIGYSACPPPPWSLARW